MRDPHLIPLGQCLAWMERGAGWGWEDGDHLEKVFLEEPWLNWLQVVFVVNPEGASKPFALLASSEGQDHARCPVNNLSGEDLEV